MNEQLVAVAIELAPKVLNFIRDEFMNRNPDEPVPTDEEIHAAYIEGRDRSLAVDDQWRKDHPTDD